MMLPGAQKCLKKWASCMAPPNAFGPGPSGLRLRPSKSLWPHGSDFTRVAGTARRRPTGSAVDIPEVPTEYLVGSSGHRPQILSARRSFPRLEPLGALFPPSLGRAGGKIEASTRCCNELSACCAAAVPRMLFSHWYISPTPLVKGVDNASRSAATAATFLLDLAKAGSYRSTCSIAVAWPTSSADSCWCRSASLASTIARSSTSSPRGHTAFRLMSSCRARRRTS
jgi:hypothetical protein